MLTSEVDGVYNTAAAAAYPTELNEALAATFMEAIPAPSARAAYATVTPDDPGVGTLPAHDPIEEWRLALARRGSRHWMVWRETGPGQAARQGA